LQDASHYVYKEEYKCSQEVLLSITPAECTVQDWFRVQRCLCVSGDDLLLEDPEPGRRPAQVLLKPQRSIVQHQTKPNHTKPNLLPARTKNPLLQSPLNSL
jgi:hypothetical protein